MQQWIPLLLIIINAAGFLIMCLDKFRAKTSRWRIPETTLLTVAAVGGSLGVLMSMLLVRHKTRHASFVILVPLFLFLHICLLLWLTL